MSKQMESTAKTIVKTKVEERAIDRRRNRMLMTEPDMEKRRANLAKYRRQEKQGRDDAHGEAAQWWESGG